MSQGTTACLHLKKTTGHTAEISWAPKSDDPKGCLAAAI